MELLHFDTENRKAIVRMTRTELQDLDSRFLADGAATVTYTVAGEQGSLDLTVEGD